MKRQNDLPVLAKKLSKVYKANVRLLGPYITKKDGRRLVDVRIDEDPTSPLVKTVQLARVRLEISLGRPLRHGETVDHIDNDCTNDDYSNVQLLSLAENSAKQTTETRRKSAESCRRHEVRQKNSISKLGDRNHQAKVTHPQVKEMRVQYSVRRINLEEIQRRCGFLTLKSVKDMLRGYTYPTAGGPLTEELFSGPVGRPSVLSPKLGKKVKDLAASGLSLAEVARRLEVSKYAVYRFMKRGRG